MEKKEETTESIMVICAHNDDQVIGCGGTIAKYAKEGKKIHTIVFSYGEGSHAWLKPEVVQETRMQELKKCNAVLGGESIRVYGLKDGKFIKGIEEKNIKEKITRAIQTRNPIKIFTHAPDDAHPDHRVVYKLMKEIINELQFKGDVYTFGVWNAFKMKERDHPRLVSDISSTFKTKIKALFVHKSQKLAIISLTWSIYWKNILNGIKNKCRYAEVFYKLSPDKQKK